MATPQAGEAQPLTDEQATFEADARALGFDLQLATSNLSGEPWCDYEDAEAGHRWAGWLARAALATHTAPSASAPAQPTEPVERLCSDCPPTGYPNDKTRCAPCPRRTAQPVAATPAFDRNTRRLTGLWRFGRDVLPTAPVSFEAFLFQLDGMIDARAPNPLAAPPAAQPVAPTEPEYETRDDGKRVRVDRWELGIRRIVALLWGNRHDFEVDDVVEAVRKLVPEPFNEGDDEGFFRSVVCERALATHPPAVQPVVPAGMAAELLRLADILRDCGRLVSTSGKAEASLRQAAVMIAAAPSAPPEVVEQSEQPLGVSPSGPGSVVASLPSIPIAAGHDLRDGDPEDDVIPTLPAGHVWCCGNGCGDCRAILIPFEYSRTETVDGELLESRSVMRAASHCCKAPLMVWNEVDDTEGPEPDFCAKDRREPATGEPDGEAGAPKTECPEAQPMSKKPAEEKMTVRINGIGGGSISFTAEGSVVGGMVEVMSWLPAERRVKALARLQAMHEQRLKVEAERAAEATKDAA